MILIADSGSTKTNWLLINGLERKKVSGDGINLHYQTEERVLSELVSIRMALDEPNVTSIFYYGTGISNAEKAENMQGILKQTFPFAQQIQVESDLIGAAKALFGHGSGLACILGTGAGTGLFYGDKIIKQVPSLGFWLGDEGSGAHLGKELVKAYLRQELGEDLNAKFEMKFGHFERHKVFGEIQHNQTPNQYFASFTPFLSENLNKPFIHKLVKQCFVQFVEKNLLFYTEDSQAIIGFVGSVAYYFKEILTKVIANYLDNDVIFLKDPIDNLAAYHAN